MSTNPLSSRLRRIGLGRISITSSCGLQNLIAELVETRAQAQGYQNRLDEVARENEQHRATITQINEKLHALSKDREVSEDRDYQLLMAQQSMMAQLQDLDAGFKPIYDACKAFTMTSVERLYGLYKAVEYIVKGKIPGDILETGVWKGGSMMLVAMTLAQLGETSRRLYLFDTYEGHPKPDAERDVDLWGNPAIDEWKKHNKDDESSNWAFVSIDDVRENLARTRYPMERISLVKGMVETTAVQNVPDRIALLRLDTDWYQSTQVSLDIFYPRLSTNGVLIIDDYGHYRGQREAVDQYFGTGERPVLLNRLDYSCRLVIKPAV